MDLMIDLETLGTGANALVVQAAAVKFNPKNGNALGVLDACFDIQKMLDAGFEVTGSTIEFWLRQSEDAKSSILGNPTDPYDFLMSLLPLLERAKHIWCHTNFDYPILMNMYKVYRIATPPHLHTKARDLRTLIDLADYDIKKLPRVGTLHSATDDCFFQIKYCADALARIRDTEAATSPSQSSKLRMGIELSDENKKELSRIFRFPVDFKQAVAMRNEELNTIHDEIEASDCIRLQENAKKVRTEPYTEQDRESVAFVESMKTPKVEDSKIKILTPKQTTKADRVVAIREGINKDMSEKLMGDPLARAIIGDASAPYTDEELLADAEQEPTFHFAKGGEVEPFKLGKEDRRFAVVDEEKRHFPVEDMHYITNKTKQRKKPVPRFSDIEALPSYLVVKEGEHKGTVTANLKKEWVSTKDVRTQFAEEVTGTYESLDEAEKDLSHCISKISKTLQKLGRISHDLPPNIGRIIGKKES